MGYDVRGDEVFYGKRVYVFAVWHTKAEKISGADGATFQILNRTTYAKDAANAFFEGRRMSGADAASFELIPPRGANRDALYARDGRRVYFEGSVLDGADPATFEVDKQRAGLARDKAQVYFGRSVIVGADPRSFEMIGSDAPIGRDKRGYYYGPISVKVQDPSSFELMATSGAPGVIWARDAKAYYIGSNATPISGTATFKELSGGYAKDGTRVSYRGEPIPGADPASFSVRVYDGDAIKGQEFVVARDKNHFYTSDMATSDIADGSTFEELGRSYARDSTQVYFLSRVVEGADPASFTTTEVRGVRGPNKGAPVVQDKDHYYQNGDPISAK